MVTEDGQHRGASISEVQGSVDDLLFGDSLGLLNDLLYQERKLVDAMKRRTHALTRAAFDWKGNQKLNWVKQWKQSAGGANKVDHVLYYYLVQDGDRQLVLEVFKPYLTDPFDRSVNKPDHLCVVEFEALTGNPLEFDRSNMRGASIFARHGAGSSVSKDLQEATRNEALAVSNFGEETYPIFDNRGENQISGGGLSFGWNVQSSSIRGERLNTRLSGSTIPQGEYSKENLFYNAPFHKDDLFTAVQRRLDLLQRAELVGVSQPPDRVIEPFAKS